MKIFGDIWHPKETGVKGLLYCLTSPIRIFCASVERLFIWFPVIWKDRDWDYSYLYDVLKKKLELMSKFEKKYAWAEKAQEVAKQMDEAIVLINKLEDDYFEESLKPFHKIYPDFELEMELLDDESNPKFKTINFKYDSDEQRELYHKCIMNEPKLRERDRKKLFKLISNNIDSWWD
jgi:hypothetical protein